MEWRSFYQVSSEDGFVHPKRTQPVEDRTDLYVLDTGVDRGIKFRSGKRDVVEIKVRTSVDANQIEQWEKHQYPIDSIGEVVPALAGVLPEELKTLAVQKRRFYQGQLEIVNIVVPPYSRSSVSTYWVSFCLEGKSAPSERELQAVKERLPQGALIGGYPTWIEALALAAI